MGGLRSFTESIIITTVFIFFIVMFAVLFLDKTNPTSDALNDTYGLNTTRNAIDDMMVDYSTLANNTKEGLANSSASPIQFVFLIFEAAFSIPKLFLSTLTSGIQVIHDSIYVQSGGGWADNALGIGLTIIFIILIIRLVLYIISAIRTGNSER